MTKHLLLLCLGTALIYSCASPGKRESEQVTAGAVQSDTTDTSYPATRLATPDSAEISDQSDAQSDSAVTISREISPFDRNDPASYFNLDNYIHPTTIATLPEEIQVVDSTCALLIYPSDKQLEALKEENGENFQAIAADNTYYHGMAIEMLDAINVETIVAETRYIDFLDPKTKKSWRIDIRKEGAPAWNLIFFKEGHEPEIIPYEDLSEDKIYEYFGINR